MGAFFSKNNNNASLKIVVLVGPTGCGKSRFIQSLVPEEQKADVPVSHMLEHIPGPVQSFQIQHRLGTDVLLVDTPGFDIAIPKSGEDVLKQVVKWMKQQHPKSTVAGILCLHRITDNRLTERPPTDLLKRLCGGNADAAKQLVLVTTHWDKTTIERGERAEAQLRQGSWSKLLRLGTATKRFDNTPDRAREIIDLLLGIPS